MTLQISTTQLEQLVERAAEIGAKIALTRIGVLKPYLTKSQSFKKYGRANIENWIKSGLITPRKDGDHSACWRIDRIEVEIIFYAIDQPLYLLLYESTLSQGRFGSKNS